MRKFLLLITIALFLGCTSEGPMVPSGVPSSDEPEYIFLDFNKWVYLQMNQQYLWREDLPDSLSCDYELAPSEFFKSLLSPKDRFSYFTNNPNYSGSSEYGFAYQKYNCQDQDVYEVLYVKSPRLKCQGMKRGDLIDIKTSAGYHVYTKLDIIDNHLKSSTSIFTEPVTRGISTSTSTVLLDSIYLINDKKIGYICYLEFDKISDIDKSFKRMYNSQIDELIIDLRYNPGGYVNTCQYLCNCIVHSTAYNDIFQKCCYNDIISKEYLKTTGLPYTLSLFKSPSSIGEELLGTTIVPINMERVFFLTSSHTASSSEAAIICLRPYMEVVVIGEATLGKGVGSWTIYDSRYKYALQPITMRYYNANNETTPDEGLMPDFYVPDGFSTKKKEIGDLNEALLSTAINVIFDQPNKISNCSCEELMPIDVDLMPIGEPSFVEEFKKKGESLLHSKGLIRK